MKKKTPLIILTALSLFLTACNPAGSEVSTGVTSATTETTAVTAELTSESTMQTTTATEKEDNITPISIDVDYLDRPNVLAKHYKPAKVSAFSAPATKLKPNSDLSNVYFGEDTDISYFDEKYKENLVKNGFALSGAWFGEYFELYEDNRYWNRANYVTVDSLMHTYHLYFAHLLKKIEKDQFAEQIKNISLKMVKTAEQHCEKLKGTEWEQAALTELAFFAVGAKLSDPSFTVPASVADAVQEEIGKIYGENIDYSAVLSGVKEDYSQYKPRGYYENDEVLQKYFRTMMWYGRMGFARKSDLLSRTALLITTGMQGDVLKDWMEIYDVTSFFAGASDDIGYCELKPVADKIYGEGYTLDSLIGNDEKWNTFRAACKGLRLPAINSVPTEWDSLEEHKEAQIGFRFMGQRFSIDQACFTHLYEEEPPCLPDALDFPASLGSDTALEILKQEGRTNERYNKKLSEVRQEIENAPDSAWNASLSSAWIYTLNPLLEKKDASYPYFMQTDAWRRRALITFEGSYTELKHDTVLYAKQFMGEMGDPEIPDNDDRGYVEAEPLVFARLKALVEATSAGLDDYGMISKKDKKNMATLAELAGKLQTIAEKELKGVMPSNQEFDLIRGYGGQLEHFYDEIKDSFNVGEESEYANTNSPALVVDIATSELQGVLEVATGNPMCIDVIVEFGGKLRCVSGAVYSFYQFTNDTRMTDSEWREKLDNYENPPAYPEWCQDLICHY